VQHIIGNGRQDYLAAVAHPRSVVDHIPAMTTQTGLYALALFRYEEMVFEAQKLRLIAAVVHPHDPDEKRRIAEKVRTKDVANLPKTDRFFIAIAQRVSGFFNVVPEIRDGFLGPEFDKGYPELYPIFEELASGEVRLKEYGKLEGDRPLGPDLKDLRLGESPRDERAP
jgi:hypothetical protein